MSDQVNFDSNPDASVQLSVALGLGGSLVTVIAKASWTLDEVCEAASASLVPERFILSIMGPGDKPLERARTLMDLGLADGSSLVALLGEYVGTWKSTGSLFSKLGNGIDREKLHLYQDHSFKYENIGSLDYPEQGDCGGVWESCGSGKWHLEGRDIVLNGQFNINMEVGYDDVGEVFEGEKKIPSKKLQLETSEGEHAAGVWRKDLDVA
eukprot:TRINITY_DN95451_c0_g1_i1.p1 TRINITY_DN95451_c0_g1~~TRINITY_DN95451_c0_g1_i1.p1  ORF type:complete len:210 (-),score=42.51 TRINITY_DN95451_c0_g1_i1:251-880(-)